MSLGSTFGFLFSNQKRRKVRLLLAEKWRALVSQKRQRQTGAGDLVVPVHSAAGEPKQWRYEADVPLPAIMFNASSSQYTEDKLVDQQRLVASTDYQTHNIEHAVFVTNETTHRSIYNSNDELIPSVSSVRQGYRAPASLKLEPERTLHGLSANLYGNTAMASGNYAHWMIDGLARLFLILQHYPLDDIDYFIVPPLKYEFHRTSLNAFGIADEKIVEVQALECLRFERLVCTSAPRGLSSNICPGWLIDHYRQHLMPDGSSATTRHRKIYISRRDSSSRKLINEDEIIVALEKHGFESVELSNYNFHDKVALFAEASCIVGLSGAGMTNLMFCQPHTRVIELQPSSNVIYLYASMCGYLDLDYYPLLFDTGADMSRVNKYYGNLHIDLNLIEQALHNSQFATSSNK